MVNTGDEEGHALAESYGVGGIPSFILMNTNGEVLDRWGGFGDSEKWAERLAEATAVTLPIADREGRFPLVPRQSLGTRGRVEPERSLGTRGNSRETRINVQTER